MTLPRDDRTAVTEANLDALLADPPASAPAFTAWPAGLDAAEARALFADMVLSRQLDLAARDLQRRGVGWYTIASAGHELNAIVGTHLRDTDPAFLHYRSGGFVLARHRRAGDDRDTILRNILRSFVASAADPVAEGRHKVWGSAERWMPPQTSTIGSHVPKASGTAFALTRARQLGIDPGVPDAAIVVCSFGDASLNQAATLVGLNSARYAVRRGSPHPLLVVCEDNGIGISVDTPRRWVAEMIEPWPHLHYVHAAGDLTTAWEATAEAVARCRRGRSPVFLHLETVRLWGHAGSDVEHAYRSQAAIEAAEARDPLLSVARALLASGTASSDELAALVADARHRVRKLADEVADDKPLGSRAAITAPLELGDTARAREDAAGHASAAARREVFGERLPETASTPTQRTMAAHLNAALADELARRPGMIVFGEDVGAKGGVYGVTRGLQRTFGVRRVFDTLLDETTILGVAQGAGLAGLLPVPEIQYLAYLHNALDQLRGEACSLRFFSGGQWANPMVVRVQGLAYQKGFGGHFHNDNAVGALRDIPGLVLAVPSRGDDAARMLRGCLGLASAHQRVVVFCEPIALYHERDLHDPGDEEWLSDYPAAAPPLLPGEVGVWHPDERDVLIVSYGNGVRMSLRAARRLWDEHGLAARVLDLRWLLPLPVEAVRAHARECAAVLVADEARATGGGIADAVVADLARAGLAGADRPVGSVASADSYVPLGPATAHVLLQEEQIVEAAVALR